MKAHRHSSRLDNSAASNFQKSLFRKGHSCASSEDMGCCLEVLTVWLSGALVVKKEVLVLAEQAEFQASAAASSSKKCPDAHEHHDYIC